MRRRRLAAAARGMPGVVVQPRPRPAHGAGAGARRRTTTPSVPRAAPRGTQLKRVAAERTPSPRRKSPNQNKNKPPPPIPPAPSEPRKWRRREGAPLAGGADPAPRPPPVPPRPWARHGLRVQVEAGGRARAGGGSVRVRGLQSGQRHLRARLQGPPQGRVRAARRQPPPGPRAANRRPLRTAVRARPPPTLSPESFPARAGRCAGCAAGDARGDVGPALPTRVRHRLAGSRSRRGVLPRGR